MGNKEIVQRYWDGKWNARRPETLDELLSPDVVCHGPVEIRGREKYKQVFVSFLSAFHNTRVTFEDLIEQGDKVVARVILTGVHGGDLPDVPATDRTFRLPATIVFRVVEGKIVEENEAYDELDLMRQLGMKLVPEREEDEAIGDLYKRFGAALESRNADEYASLFAQDGTVMLPNVPVITGRAAIREWVQRFLTSWRVEADTHVEEQEVAGRIGFRRWRASGRYAPLARGEPVPIDQKYLDVLTKDASGTWQFAAHMVSSNTKEQFSWDWDHRRGSL
jgi:steroid delta-isomerase-like uncharacterized protein/uncharacterized protein (TIGR02246 family)